MHGQLCMLRYCPCNQNWIRYNFYIFRFYTCNMIVVYRLSRKIIGAIEYHVVKWQHYSDSQLTLIIALNIHLCSFLFFPTGWTMTTRHQQIHSIYSAEMKMWRNLIICDFLDVLKYLAEDLKGTVRMETWRILGKRYEGKNRKCINQTSNTC